MTISQNLASGSLRLSPHAEFWLFMAFLLAFAIKVPIFPFHTWLPDAHVEAPTAGSVILAGVLLKMGTYGLLRFCLPLFPTVALAAAPWMSILGWSASSTAPRRHGSARPQEACRLLFGQPHGTDRRRDFRLYRSGLEGATMQMLNHGLSTGALFLLVGMIYDRRHTRAIADFGGIAHKSPVLAAFFLVVTLSSIGLPGLNGFVARSSHWRARSWQTGPTRRLQPPA